MSKIAFWNCCGGISGKLSTAEHILRAHDIEILFVAESECTPEHTWIKIPGYKTEYTGTHIYDKCRLIAFIKSHSSFSRSKTVVVQSDIEAIVFETPKHRVVGVYRPFKNINGNTSDTYLNKLIQLLTECSNTKKDTCIGGDLNINIGKVSPERDTLESWALDANMVQHVKEPTWERIITNSATGVKELKRSTLDLLFTNCDGMPLVLDKFTSDHKCLLFEFFAKSEPIVRQKLKKRTFKGYNPLNISGKISQDLSEQSLTGDSDFDSDLLTNLIKDALDHFHPLRTIRTSRATDVVDQELEKMKKKRKRLLKKYHKFPTPGTLNKIEQLNKFIKIQIKNAKQQQLNIRLEGKNPKSFWNAVAELEGKRSDEELRLNINGAMITEPKTLSEEFAKFFQLKVENLSNNHPLTDYKIGHSPLQITENEIQKASKLLKSKLCQGDDGIPMKIIKDLSHVNPGLFVDLFNSCCTSGIPTSWKIAMVRPLHKSGSTEAVTNYRPISNLNSISKLFEKIILARIEALGELDGSFQHGFKKNRSTTTAMLELQDYVATELDKNRIVGTYSIDLSAAFDLLRPDIFYQTLKDKIPLNIMQVLMDFLTERSFRVMVSDVKSNPRNLSVGCVQGSILGPRLFTLYLSELANNLPKETHIVSYADDTYVSLSSENMTDLKPALSNVMLNHDAYLKSIGMVTNVSKTELIFFSRAKIDDLTPLQVGTDQVIPKKSMKVLGVQFDCDLGWNSHASKLKRKSAMTMRKMRFLSKYIGQEGMKKVITTHMFGMLYYASIVWLNELTAYKIVRTLESIHYKCLRIAVKDYYATLSRQRLDDIFNRATPCQWMQYSNAKHAISMLTCDNAPPISSIIKNKLYVNDRNNNKISVHDTSRLKIGRNSFHNRLKCLRSINFNWRTTNQDAIRVNLKKTFFNQR